MTENHRKIKFEKQLLLNFIRDVKKQFPKKAYGYFLSTEPAGEPSEYIIMQEDVRGSFLDYFSSYGNYYKDHDDAGFLTSPEETIKIEKYIRQNKFFKVGVFHSHQRHPAILARVDVDLHPSSSVWHLLISLRTLEYPQIRVFEVSPDKQVKEIKIELAEQEDQNEASYTFY
ncbi:hypothetical protein BK131_16950 [Paenibacillus amylolyticus]|uniref:JAB domain-containing protein n=1 Tax=Paenibacillus amylolyticus TaxID=1451 RepID=A0A1R1BSZ4_PAEAM|nr:hypothetical protein [Paenibacillus amylolyticus]OMF12927.1 hypothetical protein BK131_16950 [Paenibacillus amylolyticus]